MSAAAKSLNAMHFYNLQFCKSEKSYFTESVSLLIYFFLQLLTFFLICV
jgi:hypothetical protein